MQVCVRRSEVISRLVALILWVGATALYPQVLLADEGNALPRVHMPARVVSMNLCTDQLAMLLARKGQLVSVSSMAIDPHVSPMVARAKRFRINHGRAEEIYLMRPDLVLAGTYTDPATLAMLRRLGVRVETLPQVSSLPELRGNITRVGELLGRRQAAHALLHTFDTRLAALAPDVDERRPRAVLYYANGYTLGDATLAGQILHAAGFENAATTDPGTGRESGYGQGGRLPLERLVMLQPDLVVTSRRYPGVSRSEAILDHPAVRALRAGMGQAAMTDSDWVCGTPAVLDAISALEKVRRSLSDRRRAQK